MKSRLIPVLSQPIFATGESYIQRVLTLSPLAYWPLNDAGGSTALELAGGNNGAYSGVDLAQSQPPFAAPLFDGVNDYCNIYTSWLNSNLNRSEGSLVLWAKVYNAGVWTDATNRQLFQIQTTGSQEVFKLQRTITNGLLTLSVTLGATAKSVNSTGNASTDWIHWAVTWSKTADELKAYKNGAQTGTTQTGLGTPSGGSITPTYCCIGALNTTPSQSFNGWLAHAILFDRALAPAEIAGLYNWAL